MCENVLCVPMELKTLFQAYPFESC